MGLESPNEKARSAHRLVDNTARLEFNRGGLEGPIGLESPN